MARALAATGLSMTRAYDLARRADADLTERGADRVELDRLADLAAEVLGEDEGGRTIRRLRRLHALQQLDAPIILLVGGATGTGKSTIATEAAHRLGITRVTSTDFIRQTMRAFFSPAFMPSVHYSSFEAGLALTKAEEDEAGDARLLGFLDQTRNVLVGVEAAIERSLREGWSMVLEGIHLVPGMVEVRHQEAIVVQCLVAIEDEDLHRSHFWVRDHATDGLRPLEKYLDGMSGDPPHPGLADRARAPLRRAGDHEHDARPGDGRGSRSGALDGRPARPRVGSVDSMADCLCTRYARATEWAALAGARWLGRADEEAAEEAAASGMKAALDELPIDGRIVIGARTGESLLPGGKRGRRWRSRRSRARPDRGSRRRRPRRGGGDGDARRRAGGRAPSPAGHVHAHDRGRPARARGDRPRSPGRRQRAAGRGELRPSAARHHRARPRPAATPRPDRGAARRRARGSS